ncbi:hypothetical protein CDD83_2648 [Cordyceps sp. RAO-2017]|nr:hypothetical protein CDD83_2648 [Cordyceps sp. RAO-2017]
MTAMSPAAAAAATALTPPSSSHGEAPPWEYPGGPFENAMDASATRFDQTPKSPLLSQNGFSPNAHAFDMTARKVHSADNLSTAARRDKPTAEPVVSPPPAADLKTGQSSPSEHSQQSASDSRKRPKHHQDQRDRNNKDDSSKWIHRDKLAKIESEELQAAGIFVPRTRAPSKQRRDRSQSRLAHAADPSQGRPRRNSAALDQASAPADEPADSGHWDLRTAQEIADDEANAYFTANGNKSGSRIPVAKISPAPIPLDYLERGSQAVRRPPETPDPDTLSYAKPRSRSASLSVSDQASSAASGAHAAARRSVTDSSPTKKNAPRRTSAASKTSTSTGRPKTRSGSSKDAPGTRPSTRAGDLVTAGKAPEGDPPWMLNSYKPDPRLPPDQQLLPTVARRLQQEKWEKEGRFGDAYDREFRPLNDREFLKPPAALPEGADAEAEPAEGSSANDAGLAIAAGTHAHNQADVEGEAQQQQPEEWPLKQVASKSPPLRQGSYSTMPKISDKPSASSPVASPRAAATPQMPAPAPQVQDAYKAPEPADHREKPKKKKGPCGCCVVM